MAAPLTLWRHDAAFGKSRDSLVPLFARASTSSSLGSEQFECEAVRRSPRSSDERSCGGDLAQSSSPFQDCSQGELAEETSPAQRVMRQQISRILYVRRVIDNEDCNGFAPELDNDQPRGVAVRHTLNCGRDAKVLFDHRKPLPQANGVAWDVHTANPNSLKEERGDDVYRLRKRSGSKVLFQRPNNRGHADDKGERCGARHEGSPITATPRQAQPCLHAATHTSSSAEETAFME